MASSAKTRCTHHDGLCAYDGDEPDRCQYCHSLWTSILSREDCPGREDHLADHARREAARLRSILRKRSRAAGRVPAPAGA